MLTTYQLAQKIDEWVFCARDREILKRRLCDGVTFQALAEETGMSVNGIKGRYRRAADKFDAAMQQDGYTRSDYTHDQTGA